MTCKDCPHYEACKGTYMNVSEYKSITDFDSEHYADIYHCPDFADKSEWVHLPCTAGDKIFMIVVDIEAGTAFVDEGKVISVIYECTGVWISARYECGLFYHHKFGSGDYFFTIAEAEKALAERKEK